MTRSGPRIDEISKSSREVYVKDPEVKLVVNSKWSRSSLQGGVKGLMGEGQSVVCDPFVVDSRNVI